MRGDTAIRILTDRAAVAGRLGQILRDAGGFKVLGQSEAGPVAVLLLDCVQLDSQRRGRLRRSARRHRPARVLWLLDAAPADDAIAQLMLGAVRAGWCHGYVLEGCPAGTLVRAVTAVADRDVWLPRAVLLRALYELEDPGDGGIAAAAAHATHRPRTLLTPRERQVFRLVRSGLINKEIGLQLDITEDTVKKHLRNMYAKLGVRHRAQMLAKGLENPRTSG